MAKNKAAKKPATKKAAGVASRPRRKLPEQPVLGGLEQARHVMLDKWCRKIAECRETINQAKVDEQSYCGAAQGYMHDHEVQVYSQHGVELVLVPGVEKLRVRLVDAGEGRTSTGTDVPSDVPSEDTVQ